MSLHASSPSYLELIGFVSPDMYTVSLGRVELKFILLNIADNLLDKTPTAHLLIPIANLTLYTTDHLLYGVIIILHSVTSRFDIQLGRQEILWPWLALLLIYRRTKMTKEVQVTL